MPPPIMTKVSEKENKWDYIASSASDLEKKSGSDKNVKPLSRVLTRNLIILAFVAGLLVTLGFGFYMAKGFQYRSNQQEWLQKIIYTGVGTNATTMEKLRLYKRNLHFQLWWCIAGVVYWGLFSIYQCSLSMKGMIKRDDVFRFHLVSEKELGLILRSILGIFLVIWTVMFAADLFVIWVELSSVTLLMRGD